MPESVESQDVFECVIQGLNDAAQNILFNKPYIPLRSENVSDGVKLLESRINMLAYNLKQLYEFLIELSQGNLNVDIPPRTNYLASGAKQLHANLAHLTWQAQQIAEGDYSQNVDFMGELAD